MFNLKWITEKSEDYSKFDSIEEYVSYWNRSIHSAYCKNSMSNGISYILVIDRKKFKSDINANVPCHLEIYIFKNYYRLYGFFDDGVKLLAETDDLDTAKKNAEMFLESIRLNYK